MKRRKAIGIISASAFGAALIPACQWTSHPTFKNFEIKRSDYQLLGKLSHKILPIPEEMILENATPEQFALTMLDDCTSPEDIQKFVSGLENLKSYMKENKIDENKVELNTLQMLMDKSSEDENVDFLLNNLKRYNLQYYRSLNDYLSTYTDFEFIPGRFSGCVNV